MLDPLQLPNPAILQTISQSVADKLALKTLPAHAHQILFAITLYHSTFVFFSPTISSRFFAATYDNLPPRTRLNWNVHAVALLQSVVICGLAVWVMWCDEERKQMNWQERVYGYTGALGMLQAFAAGYFMWDLYVCLRYYSMFGLGMLIHAVAALSVFALGFRPFVNYYSPNFLLYEISSPFLNIHWFCDKLRITGGTMQLVNGIILLVTFAGGRLIYGSYASYSLARDILRAVSHARSSPSYAPLALSHFALDTTTVSKKSIAAIQVFKYTPAFPHIPAWIWAANLASTLTMNILNWYWYRQMVAAIRKRFDPPLGTRVKPKSDADIKYDLTREIDATGKKTLRIDSYEFKQRPSYAFSRLMTSDMPPAST